jgi:hypothetical protein
VAVFVYNILNLRIFLNRDFGNPTFVTSFYEKPLAYRIDRFDHKMRVSRGSVIFNASCHVQAGSLWDFNDGFWESIVNISKCGVQILLNSSFLAPNEKEIRLS